MRAQERYDNIISIMPISPYVYFVLAGLFGGVSFLSEGSAWLIIVLGICVIYGTLKSNSIETVIYGSSITGFLKTLIATSWVLTAYPFDWLTTAPHSIQIIPLVFTWFGTALSIGLGTTAGAVVLYLVKEKTVLKYVAIFCFFAIADIIGAFFFSLFTIGPNHLPNIHFGFSMYGYTLADHGLLLHIASIGGVLALSLALGGYVSVSYIFHEYLQKKNYSLVLIYAMLMFIATSFFPLSHYVQTAETPVLVSVQTHYLAQKHITFEETQERQGYLLNAIGAAQKFNPKIILLPESAGLTAYKNKYRVLDDLTNLGISSTVVDVTNMPIEGGTVQRAYIYDIESGDIYTVEKKYSIPIGEYLPYIHYWISRLLGIHAIMYIANQERGSVEIPFTAGVDIPTVLFCSESASPLLTYSRHSRRDPELIVHPVSHSWFRSPYAYWNQERQMLRVQSVFLKAPILQAGNESPVHLFMPNGGIRNGTVSTINNFVQLVTF
jgi:apolipoprotein N-acyltransferase